MYYPHKRFAALLLFLYGLSSAIYAASHPLYTDVPKITHQLRIQMN